MRYFKKCFLAVILMLSLCLAFAFTACNNTDEPEPVDNRTFWGTLSGTVVDYYTSPVQASPVAGVTVKSGDESATTDENGYYTIKVYNNGATVSFEKEGRMTQSTTLKKSSFRDEKAEYGFIMYASAKVEGTVKDKNGNALSGASVSIGIQQTSTNAQGKFSFDEVIATSMVIVATHNGTTVRQGVTTEEMLTGSVTVEIVI